MLRHQRVSPICDISLQLSFEFVNLIAQISNNIFIGADVLGDHFLIRFDAHLDIFSAICVLKCVDGLFILGRSW